MDFVKDVKDGTVTISIKDFDRMRALFKKEKEKLNEEIKEFKEEKEKIDKDFVKILIYEDRYLPYSKRIEFVSKDEALEKIIASREKIIIEDAKNKEKNSFYKMNVFQFLKWKKYRKNWIY